MKIINTYWEKKNLNVESCDILLETLDTDFDIIEKNISDYIVNNNVKYITLRFDSSSNHFIEFANRLGFKFIENMIKFSLNRKDYHNSSYRLLQKMDNISYKITNDTHDYDFVLDKISEGIFCTDRISVDKKYGKDVANRRYYNYVNSIKSDSKYKLVICYINDEPFGFDIRNVANEVYVGTLGGLFKESLNMGVGLLWEKTILDAWFNECKTLITDVSSNNVQIVKVVEYFGFRIKQLTYVYIKHL